MIKKKTVVVMKCPDQQCMYGTDEDIPKDSSVAEKLQIRAEHIRAMHAPPPVQPAPAVAGTEKFLRPKRTLVDGNSTEAEA